MNDVLLRLSIVNAVLLIDQITGIYGSTRNNMSFMILY